MKNIYCCNVRKHREIKGSEKYFTLNISLKFDSLDKMIITSSESEDNSGISRKEFITYLGIKAKTRPKKSKKARYDIRNVSKKDLSNIIREFDKLFYKSYERRSPKHDPNDS